MRRALLLALLFLPGLLRAELSEITASLRAEPVSFPDSDDPLTLERASGLLHHLPVQPAEGDRVYSTRLPVIYKPLMESEVVLVEPAQGEPFLYADQDLDGRLAPDERFAFGPREGKGRAVLLRFPITTTGLPFYPVLVSVPEAGGKGKEETRELLRSSLAYLSGTITVVGREILVRYPLDASTGAVNLSRYGIGMDTDGDGVIATDLASAELDHGRAGTLLFRVGGMVLSTTRVEAAAGRVVLRVHPAAEYRRFDLRPGGRIDFDYIDPWGAPRSLSDLRGKVVLLDFWGTWCVHCIKEMPLLRKAYAAYRERGFEILGMDARDDLAQLQAFIAGKDVPWLHATADSVSDVIENRFAVRAFPTKILIDREGRVVAAGTALEAPALYGEALLKTVEEVLDRPVQP